MSFRLPWRSISRSISVVLPVIALLAAGPASAATPEAQAVLQAIESGNVPRPAVEAVLAQATAGDAESAEVAGRLFDRGVGVKWDPPTALRWYTAAAVAGSATARKQAARLWRGMPPVSQRRAEAMLAHFFSDAELAAVGLGPVRRPANQRSWMTHLEAAGVLPEPPAPAPTPVQVQVPVALAAPAVEPVAPAPTPPPVTTAVAVPIPTAKPMLPGIKTAMVMPKARKPQPPMRVLDKGSHTLRLPSAPKR